LPVRPLAARWAAVWPSEVVASARVLRQQGAGCVSVFFDAILTMLLLQ
jgi:hypothetical protein